MRSPLIPILGVLTVIAGAAGLQLGESAIAQIDPTYFQAPPSAPRDVSNDPGPQRLPSLARASGWEEGYAAREADCPDCPLVPERQAMPAAVAAGPAPPYRAAASGPRWEYASSADTARVAEVLRADEERIERAVTPRRMDRYLNYPVSSEQAESARKPQPEALPPEPELPVGL